MDVQNFTIGSYIAPHEAFHLARKELPSGWPARAHTHDYCEMFLIEAGRVDHWVNGQVEKLSAGRLVFMRPSDAHALSADRRAGCQIANLMFRTETAQHLAQRYPEAFRARLFDRPGRVPETHRLDQTMQGWVQDMMSGLLAAPRSLSVVEGALLTLVNRLQTPVVRATEAGPQWFEDACRAAQAPRVFRDGVPAFVEAAGRSHEHVCRTAREVLGLSPSAYINKVRITHAARLLATSRAPIADVAAECGLENLSHFYRLFRAAHNMTPRAYRLCQQRDPFR